MEPAMKIRISVKGVRSAKDAYGRALTIIDFVEPINWKISHTILPMGESETNREAGMIAIQIQKGVQQMLESTAPSEMLRLTLVLTIEELEAFGIEPYPNEVYDLRLENGALRFEKAPQELMK